MSSDFSPELRRELLDDFYAECDELLEGVRTNLVQLEQTVAQRLPATSTIDRLFRGLHSLKGISAIAGLRPAEDLAHAMEDLLRALLRAGAPPTAEAIDLLLTSAQRLEQVVASHRVEKPLPEIAELAGRLRKQAGAPQQETKVVTPPSPADAVTDPLADARARGLSLWRGIFSPTPELDRRGVNLAAMRERLGKLGEILSVVPVIRPKQPIEFIFTIGGPTDPGDPGAWAEDGVRFERIADESTASTTERADRDENAVETLSLTPSHIVRVDLSRLDELMRITGEIVIQRSRLEERIIQTTGEMDGALKEANLALARSMRDLRKAISQVRMVPIAEIFTRMPYAVRDLARGSDKKVRVVLEGHQTEIDKYLVERLKEPLLHLVRNAFSHGIETAAEREAAGKAPEATILLKATSAGESVTIQVRDDGRGVDAATIAARAKRLGLAVPERMDAAGLLAVLCLPGFSTRDEADRVAGRGVGMDVVANTVRELGGVLTLETAVGRGTEFTLRLPLTVSIADALLVAVGAEVCAIPQTAVDEIVQVSTGEIRVINEAEVVPYRGGLLPFRRLREMFGMAPMEGTQLTLVVVSSERGATGLAVDRMRGRREIVVRPLTDPLVRVPGFSGATELGDGRPILILDPAAVTKGVVRPSFAAAPAERSSA